MGLAPDLKVIAEGMIKASMGMVEVVMPGARDTAIALFHELDRQHGMAGDDDAGHAFAAVYKSAAATTLDKIGFSAYVMAETGRGLMRNAREFMAEESRIASEILKKQVDYTGGMGDPGNDCTESFLGLGEELNEVVGDTAWWDQYGGLGTDGGRFRGSPEKLRDVAGSWRAGGKLMLRFLEDAQVYAHTADHAHSGEAADAFRRYFKGFVGFAPPPDEAHPHETLVANLVAACRQLAKACDRYADHVETAKRKILHHETSPHIDMPWDSPKFGGNGYDGGLHDAVSSDPYIRHLGNVAHALDESQSRVKIPGGSSHGPHLPGFPGLPLLPVPEPLPLVLASYSARPPGFAPLASPYDPSLNRDPIPPEPGTTRLLSAADEASFRAWANSLPPGGFAGGRAPTHPANAYQLRVAGYPERELFLPAHAVGGSGKGLTVDGLRPVDGYAVEAKYVQDPGCNSTFRTLDRVDQTLGTPPKLDKKGEPTFDPVRDAMFAGDAKELDRYKEALADPRNSQVRGFEIVTNDPDSVPYWESMMAMGGVTGTARYVQ